MYIVLGATGHVGRAVAETLLRDGHAVTAVVRDADKASDLAARGATIAVADITDSDALRDIFRRGRRAFLLNPPGDPSGDIDAAENASVAAIVTALNESRLERVVAESTYGAQDCDRCGDLGTLWRFEDALRRQAIPVSINRGAYYFTNWDAQHDVVADTGVLTTPLPADLALPMVSPTDLGRSAADLLTRDAPVALRHVEGPRQYTPNDVAAAFAAALGRDVRVETVPRDDWPDMFARQGFSAVSAQSYARMTAMGVNAGFTMPDDPLRGTITLEAHVRALVDPSG